MKKISYIELSSIFLTILITFNCGINLYILKKDASINSWISIIISYILSIIPLLLTMFIANYKKELNLFEKNKNLFGDFIGELINIFISIILFVIAITILYNIVSFITTQFLYRTPIIISAIILLSLSVYCSTKEINVIAHISLILVVINIIMFILSNLSLINEIKIDNLLPILKTDQNKLLLSSLKITIINTLPSLTILIIPKEKITNEKKYNKWLIIAYLVAFFITLVTIINTIGILSIYLTNTFEYSEYMVLKKVKLFGFLERTENIISMSYITHSYIYLTLILYTISKNIKQKSNKTFKIANTIVAILIILTIKQIFTNITIFNNFINGPFIYITSLLLAVYIIITIKIIFTKRKVNQR